MKGISVIRGTLTIVLLLTALSAYSQILNERTLKIGRTLQLIDEYYVDSTDMNELTEEAITNILKGLDPHSVYISEEDVRDMNEPLNGNFEGIGVQFNLLHDSILIIEPIAGGPSERVGIIAGDRIITIDGENVAGIGISTSGVRKRLMGDKGTKVDVEVFRKGSARKLDFTIIRDKIPINSLDAAYMVDEETGYTRLNKFAATTAKEFSDAVDSLKKQGMKHLILDLRGNGGGYMLAATALADKFFSDRKLIVYIKGRKIKRQNHISSGAGSLSSSRIVILTDERSASASEILAGALQDWDRGVIVGRRTFGKGLVQNGYHLDDGSMIRLTIARYYTPTGRSIQTSYDEGYDKYIESFSKRYTDGELVNADSIHFPDSLKYNTLINNRLVYGGGGIMPDIFVAADTTYNSSYLNQLAAKTIPGSFVLEYYDRNMELLNDRYKTFQTFNEDFSFTSDDIASFIKKGEEEGVKYDEEDFARSEKEILLILKGLVANNLWQSNEYYQIINENDKVIEKALEIISDEESYNNILGHR